MAYRNPFINQRGFCTPSRVLFPVTWLSKYWLEPSLTLWREFKSYKGNTFPEITRKNYGTKKYDGALQVQGDERKYNPDGWRFSWGRLWPEGKAGTCACDEKSNIGCGNIHFENIYDIDLRLVLLLSRKRELSSLLHKINANFRMHFQGTGYCNVPGRTPQWPMKIQTKFAKWWQSLSFLVFIVSFLWLVADRPHEQWARREQTLFSWQ